MHPLQRAKRRISQCVVCAMVGLLAIGCGWYFLSRPGPTIPFGTRPELRKALQDAFVTKPPGGRASRPGWAYLEFSEPMERIESFGNEALPALVANLNNRDKLMRLQAIELLGRLDAEVAVPPLLAALRYDDETEDWFIIAKLAEITDHPKGYEYYRRWFSLEVQREATQAYRNWYAAYRAPAVDATDALKYRNLIQQLVSPNEEPMTQNRSSSAVKFPAGYDFAAQQRIDAARHELHDHIEECIPFLIEALEDNRYCMTINWADGDGFYNKSVGSICRNVLETHLEVYRNKMRFSGPQQWHQFTYKQISKEWWDARIGRPLFELQIEAVQWAINRIELERTKIDAQARLDRKKEIEDLRSLCDDIQRNQKATKPRPMHRMAMHDVGTIR